MENKIEDVWCVDIRDCNELQFEIIQCFRKSTATRKWYCERDAYFIGFDNKYKYRDIDTYGHQYKAKEICGLILGIEVNKMDTKLNSKSPVLERLEEEMAKNNTPKYYDNTNGSLYLFAHQHNLNAWEFDLIKRIVRCRKKGNFKEDLEKSKTVIELYLKEYGTNN